VPLIVPPVVSAKLMSLVVPPATTAIGVPVVTTHVKQEMLL
jgi:hypothetical protein